jgi:hypothetical protein
MAPVLDPFHLDDTEQRPSGDAAGHATKPPSFAMALMSLAPRVAQIVHDGEVTYVPRFGRRIAHIRA